MAAPERFAEKSDSSCTAGTVHTWPIATVIALQPIVRFWGAKRQLAKSGSFYKSN
jgi:hypothetical protein